MAGNGKMFSCKRMKVEEEKILAVAYRLFRQKGVRSTSLQHIARACGTSVWDINRVFQSKKDMVLAAVRHRFTQKSAYLLINPSLSPSAVAELHNFFQFIEDHIADLGPDIWEELRRYHPVSLDQLQELVDHQLIPYLQRNVERGLQEGFYRNDLDYELYVPTYFYILRTVLESNRQDWTDTKRTIRHIHDLFFHGTLNVKGMRI